MLADLCDHGLSFILSIITADVDASLCQGMCHLQGMCWVHPGFVCASKILAMALAISANTGHIKSALDKQGKEWILISKSPSDHFDIWQQIGDVLYPQH